MRKSGNSVLSFGEFVTLMALMMSLVALSIDAILPALPDMGRDLRVTGANDGQLVVSLLFFGLAFGQVVYGPLSDSFGRKPAVYLGFLFFFIGCFFSIFATDLSTMLIGRFLQGLGLAGPRVVSVALIRDQYAGRAMARVMSFVMVIFILVPTIAPALGQGILMVADWQAIYWVFLVLGLVTVVWFSLRQRETLPLERRKPFSFRRILGVVGEVLKNKVTMRYTIAAGFVSSPFIGYLNSAQPIFQDQYRLGGQFPLYFAICAIALGAAAFLNGKFVLRFGMRLMSKWAVAIQVSIAVVSLFGIFAVNGHPPLWLFMTYLVFILFCNGILFGNLNALAMEPLGHIAGIGAAVVGSLSTFISIPFGIIIGRSFSGTVSPLCIGFTVFAVLTFFLLFWPEDGQSEIVKQHNAGR
jgi:DHA1 family bicyclomycin/chloramphenicol resistance-like MFS transporter